MNGDMPVRMTMSIVLVSEITLTPDNTVAKTPKVEAGGERVAVENILNILKDDIKNSNPDEPAPKKTYLNSLITEITVKEEVADFRLNLFMRPTIDIVSLELYIYFHLHDYSTTKYNPFNASA